MSGRVLLLNSQIPFARGGAELLVDSLGAELERRGWEVDTVRLPFSLSSRKQLLKSALAWRMLDVDSVEGRPVDLVIATRFPSYLARHRNKVVWLIHQLRQVYDLQGSRYSDFDTASPVDARAMEMVRTMDRQGLSEARRLCAISGNTAGRLHRYNDLRAEVVYPPPQLADALEPGDVGDYVFTAGRLDRPKRFDLLLRALVHAPGVRAVIAGTGPRAGDLRRLAGELEVAERVDFAGWVDDDEMVRLYRGCRAVFYAPYDEDYGYVTVEALRCAKPVVTTRDAGGVLEFVEDGVHGLVCPPEPRPLGRALAALAGDRELAQRLGAAGPERVAGVTWERAIGALVGG